MKHIRISLLALTAALISQTSTFAKSDSGACAVYSKIGGSMVEFMLPLTLQDFVEMMNGKNPKLMEDMTNGLMSNLDGNDIVAMTDMGGEDAELLGQAAGQVAVEILMAGQATSKRGIASIMQADCETVTADAIILNQKKSNAAIAANYGQ